MITSEACLKEYRSNFAANSKIFNAISKIENVISLIMVYDCQWWHDSYWRNNDRVQSIIFAQQGIFATQQAGCDEQSSLDYTHIPYMMTTLNV